LVTNSDKKKREKEGGKREIGGLLCDQPSVRYRREKKEKTKKKKKKKRKKKTALSGDIHVRQSPGAEFGREKRETGPADGKPDSKRGRGEERMSTSSISRPREKRGKRGPFSDPM